MAKNNNLTDFLTGVADAIRRKRGTTGKINPQNFEEEISGIPAGKTEEEKNITITENGTTIVLPDAGKTISKITITVNVGSGGGGGYTVEFTGNYNFSVSTTLKYYDDSTGTLDDPVGKTYYNVSEITFTDTTSSNEYYVLYRMPASGDVDETLYLMPTATLVLTADVKILEVGK